MYMYYMYVCSMFAKSICKLMSDTYGTHLVHPQTDLAPTDFSLDQASMCGYTRHVIVT